MTEDQRVGTNVLKLNLLALIKRALLFSVQVTMNRDYDNDTYLINLYLKYNSLTSFTLLFNSLYHMISFV